MTDFASLRETMVASQIRPNRVTNTRLLAALLITPREAYLPPELQPVAYAGEDIALAGAFPGVEGRFLLSPLTFAWLAQAATIAPEDNVLDIGTATGYSAAVLAALAGRVTAVEEDESLAAFAQKALTKQGIGNAALTKGPLNAGAAGSAPFNVIIINGFAAEIPAELPRQLAEGGRLVTLTSEGTGSKLCLYEKNGGVLRHRVVLDAGAPDLPGFSKKPAFTF
jgi:protein-L-isoaspartate(D-aspartate) O-methyltransferase